jgi:LuxR family maltose regulon positive regulatory protein
VSTSLLKTKLYVPPIRSELVSRTRLVERLTEGVRRGCRLTLISAPAGYGKTTLLAEWVTRPELRPRVAWVSLDTGDNDPARFWTYVIVALQTVQSDIGDIAQAALQSVQPPPMESVLTGLLNQIAQAPEPIVLVLDDYHVISALAIHNALAFLVENMPLQMHLVLATRADPLLPIPRLRGRGQLVELYQSDLRFTSEEAAEFLNRAMGLDLLVEDVAALERRTEGWIAGLQMAAVSMRGRDDVAGFVHAFTGSHRYILDYLGEEVLRQQPENVRRFLLHTAILDRLCGELCDDVIGAVGPAESRSRADSQAMLEHLERNNLFVVPLDDERRWYRYHHLFADLLRQRMQRERRDLVPELHHRAAEWYQARGWISEAIDHALASGDCEWAADLIEQVAQPTLVRDELTTLLGWLDALPDKWVRSRPQLGISRAWALAFAGRVDDAEVCLAEINVQGVQDQATAVRAYIAGLGVTGQATAVRAHIAGQGVQDQATAVQTYIAGLRSDVSLATELAHRALEHLPREDLFLRGRVAIHLGTAHWRSGDVAAASTALTQAITLGRAAHQNDLTLSALAVLGHVQKVQGLLRQTVQTYRQALELANTTDNRPAPSAGIAHVGIAESLYEQNDLEGAMHHAMEGIRLRELGGFATYPLLGHFILARVLQARGDLDGALEAYQAAKRSAHNYPEDRLAALMGDRWCWLWLAQGNVETAFRWAREHRLGPVDPIPYVLEIEQLGVARVLVALATAQGPTPGGEGHEALALLARLLEAAEAQERTGSLIKILPLLALAFQAQGDVDRALSALSRALSLAEPEGYVRTFIDEGEPMARLLRLALSRGIAPDYVARLLAALGEEAELTSPAMESLVEPLTERELEVLRLIVAGLSNPEIAEELFIAVSTVKSHVNHIYGKLGVESRTQALVKAQDLGLL